MESKYTYSLYIHTLPKEISHKENDMRYVGITRQDPPEKRWFNGFGYRHNQLFTNAIVKYGWDNFTHEILFRGLNAQEACELEKEYISLYDCTNKKKGYNISPGGFGECPDHSGENNQYSKPVYQFDKYGNFIQKYVSIVECVNETGVSHTSISNGANYHRLTCGYWFAFDDNVTQVGDSYQINYKDTNDHRYKKVCSFTKDGKYLKTFENVTLACEYYNLSRNDVQYVLKGKMYRTHGYIFRYYNQVQIDKEGNVKDIPKFARKGKKYNGISQIDLNGNIVNHFQNINDIINKVQNCAKRTLSRAIKDSTISYKYYWILDENLESFLFNFNKEE